MTDSISKVKAKLETYFDWHGGSIHADTAKISNKSVWISWIDICSLLVKIFARKIGLVRKKIWNDYLGAMSTWFTPKPALLPPVKPTEIHRKTTANQPMVQSTKATAIIKTPWPIKPEFKSNRKKYFIYFAAWIYVKIVTGEKWNNRRQLTKYFSLCFPQR